MHRIYLLLLLAAPLAANFPALAANYTFQDPTVPGASPLADIVKPFTVFDLRGLKVGVIGMGNLSSLTSIFDQPNRLGITPLDNYPGVIVGPAFTAKYVTASTPAGSVGDFIDDVGEGDVLVVTRIDRLARSISDLQDIVRTLKARDAALRATEQPIDTSTAAGKCFLDMLGVFAEFETNLRRERQLEGIAKAKAAGVYKGRKPSIDVTRIKALKASGLGPTEIARKLKIGRASVYRVVAQRADAR